MYSTYGTTELGGVCFKAGIFESDEIRAKSIGKISTSGYKVEIRDENGQSLPSFQSGEIYIHSPIRMINYLHNMEKDPLEWVRAEFRRTDP